MLPYLTNNDQYCTLLTLCGQFYNVIQMKRQNLNLTTSPHKDFQHLISSIQDKLQLLASQNFDVSHNHPFTTSMPCQTDHSPSKSCLQLQDLQCPSQSPVMSRINRLQEQYLSQITHLNNKLSLLETDYHQVKQDNTRLHNLVFKLQTELQLVQESNNKMLQQRLQQLQQNLMRKLRIEIDQEISNYIVQLQQMRREISLERKNKKQLQKEKDLLISQRNNFQFLYKEILQKYKQNLQSDIENYQKDSRLYENQQNKVQNQPMRKLKESKKRKSKQEKSEQMTKQQLIPFLTKGIEELKQKLKLK